MDKFKCVECGKIFDEFEADYNFMANEGKELCDKCIIIFKDYKVVGAIRNYLIDKVGLNNA